MHSSTCQPSKNFNIWHWVNFSIRFFHTFHFYCDFWPFYFFNSFLWLKSASHVQQKENLLYLNPNTMLVCSYFLPCQALNSIISVARPLDVFVLGSLASVDVGLGFKFLLSFTFTYKLGVKLMMKRKDPHPWSHQVVFRSSCLLFGHVVMNFVAILFSWTGVIQ